MRWAAWRACRALAEGCGTGLLQVKKEDARTGRAWGQRREQASKAVPGIHHDVIGVLKLGAAASQHGLVDMVRPGLRRHKLECHDQCSGANRAVKLPPETWNWTSRSHGVFSQSSRLAGFLT